jgi:hypothetical protein
LADLKKLGVSNIIGGLEKLGVSKIIGGIEKTWRQQNNWQN